MAVSPESLKTAGATTDAGVCVNSEEDRRSTTLRNTCADAPGSDGVSLTLTSCSKRIKPFHKTGTKIHPLSFVNEQLRLKGMKSRVKPCQCKMCDVIDDIISTSTSSVGELEKIKTRIYFHLQEGHNIFFTTEVQATGLSPLLSDLTFWEW